MVAAAGPTAAIYDDGDFSVFPPSLHEGLTATLTLDSPSPSTSASVEGLDVSKGEEVAHVSRTPISESARRLVDSGTELIRCKLAALRGRRGCCDGGVLWAFAALAGFAGVLMCMKRWHRREKELLLFLILEKDERMNQLTDHIVKMSEIIVANHKVPVVRRA